MLDVMYLYSSFGSRFVSLLLDAYMDMDVEKREMLAQVHFLYRWYTLRRLLWALEHNYATGVELRLRQLKESLGATSGLGL